MKKLIGLCVLFSFMFTSCSKRNITYFSNLDVNGTEVFTTSVEDNPIIIEIGDELEIIVRTLNPESNLLFNYGMMAADGGEDSQLARSYPISTYTVDENGDIEFPIVGKIPLAGLTLSEGKKKVKSLMGDLVNDAKIEMKISNFKVTVLGEVNNPSTFTIDNDRVTVIDALGLAGDMTVYGKRENVLIIREMGDSKMLFRINLNDKELLNSSNFFLKQNDVMYVEADKKKLIQADINPTTIAILSIASSIAVAVIFNFQEIFR